MLLSMEIVDFLLEQTMIYAQRINPPIPGITRDDMQVLIGRMLLSGCNTLPGKRCYWEQGSGTRNEMVFVTC